MMRQGITMVTNASTIQLCTAESVIVSHIHPSQIFELIKDY